MKIKLSLFFIYIVVLCLDISCGNKCEDDYFELVGVRNIEILELTSTGRTKLMVRDSIPFDSLIFNVNFVERLITSSKNFSLINSSYATPACKGPYIKWELDSIKIFRFENNLWLDVTNNFALLSNYLTVTGKGIDNSDQDFIRDLNYHTRVPDIVLSFKLIDPPPKSDDYKYKFQFFDQKGFSFEKVSSSVRIIP